MKILAEYNIPYKGLSIGNHSFEFKIDDRFWNAFDGSEISQGDVDVRVELDKQSTRMQLYFEISGAVEVACDRCLEEVMLPVEFESELQIRFAETEQESNGEVMWISPNESELSLGQYIYESILLNLPYQRVHPTDFQGKSLCDPEMLSRFEIVTQEEFDQVVAQKAKGVESDLSEDRAEATEEDKNERWKEQLAVLKTKMEK